MSEELIKTPPFILAFPSLVKKDTYKNHSITMVFDEGCTDLSVLRKAIEQERKTIWPEKEPKGFKHPLQDGDEVSESTDKGIPDYEGRTIMRAKTTKDMDEIPVLDQREDFERVEDLADVKPGNICSACVTLRAYNNAGKKGVAVTLKSLTVVHEGIPYDPEGPPITEEDVTAMGETDAEGLLEELGLLKKKKKKKKKKKAEDEDEDI